MSEVVTMSELKRKHWINVIRECKESGEPVERWCRENHITKSSYWYWHKKLGDEAAARAVSVMPEFAELKEPVPAEETNKAILIEKNGIHVQVRDGVSEELLTKLMRGLANV